MAILLRPDLYFSSMRTIGRVIGLQCRRIPDTKCPSSSSSTCSKRLLHFSSPARSQPDHTARHMIRPTDFDKKVLVWTKKYPAIDKVPSEITPSVLKKARDLMRIRVNLGMIFATVLGCVFFISWGRRLHKSGDSLNKRGQEWERQMREQGKREREAAALEVNK